VVRPHAVWGAVADLHPIDEPAWVFDEEVPEGGEEPTEVRISHSVRFTASYTWDAGQWWREQDGVIHETDQGEQISATNVVIMRVDTSPGTRTDAGGNPTVEIDVIGEGELVLLRDGQAFYGTWRKNSGDDQFQWLDERGDPLPLAPGNTWIEMVPTNLGGGLTVDVPEPEPTEDADGS
jgi:hypothetical protein